MQIIAAGGGGFMMEPRNPLLDLYILAQANKKNPRICFLPTASGDSQGLINYFEQSFEKFPCHPSVLELVSPKVANLEGFLLSQDIIYVGGGNTKTMLGIWKEWGIPDILKKAYQKGIILAGISAGSVCWHEACVSDSIPGKFIVLPCLGFIKGSNCPHYSSQSGRPSAYHRFLKKEQIMDGYATDDGVALHYKNNNLLRIVSSRSQASAYRVSRNDKGQTVEEILAPQYLEDETVFNTLIASTPLAQ